MLQFKFLRVLGGLPPRTQRFESFDLPASATARATAFNRGVRGGKAAEDAEKFEVRHYQPFLSVDASGTSFIPRVVYWACFLANCTLIIVLITAMPAKNVRIAVVFPLATFPSRNKK